MIIKQIHKVLTTNNLNAHSFSYIYNMRKPLFTFCILFFATYLSAQWVSVGTGASWDVLAFATYQSNLYVGGAFKTAGGLPADYMAQWNGTSWNTVGTGIKFSGNAVTSLTTYDSLLFATGQFDTVGTISCKCIAQWNGANWDTVGSGITNLSGQGVTASIMYNKELYVGGDFSSSLNGKKIYNIAKWNGKTWDSVGNGVNSWVWCLTNYNGMLYAGGNFSIAGENSANSIASWDGTKWDSLGSGINGGFMQVYALCVCNGKLYAAGKFTAAGGGAVNNIAVWDGNKWDSVGHGLNNTTLALTVYDGKLVALGYFDSAGGHPASEIAYWDGSNWYPVGAGLGGGTKTTIDWALYVYDSTLYAGGEFTISGSTPLNNIAMWTGPLGVDEVKRSSEEVKVWPNPSDGIFNFQADSHQPMANSRIEVYNMLGQQIANSQWPSASSLMQIDISNEPAGIYLYRIVSDKGELIASGKLTVIR